MSELHRSSSAHQESCIRAGVLLVAVFLSLRTANHVKLTCCINNPNAFTFERSVLYLPKGSRSGSEKYQSSLQVYLARVDVMSC